MRADEYLVEEVKRLKEENDNLIKENKSLVEENKNLVSVNRESQNTELPGDMVNIDNIVGEIYYFHYMKDYNIKKELESNNITKEDLEKALIDDEYIFNYNNPKFNDYYSNDKLIAISTTFYNYLLQSCYGDICLKVYSYQGKLQCTDYVIDNEHYFFDYDEAKKVGMELLRKEIKSVLDKLESKK